MRRARLRPPLGPAFLLIRVSWACLLGSLEAGQGPQLLVSHDAGWFDPALPGGGAPRPFTELTTTFLPALRAAGVGPDVVDDLCVRNPFRAFAR